MCYIIGGPTASGKSKLALWLAQHVDGEIVNADSLQLYKSIPILSASPDNEELAQTRHHLFGVYHDDQISTVQAWVQLAKSTIDDIRRRQKTPIIVGGTGMYLNALIHGLSPVPEISDDIKKSVRDLQNQLSSEDFYFQVISHDPEIKNHLHQNDTQRLGRALEVVLQTGHSIKHFQGNPQPILKNINQFILTMPDKARLYDLINYRALKMIDNGAIQEVRALKQNVQLEAPVCKAIGVKEIWQYLDKTTTKEEMISLLQQSTRQYAKRQLTWFKNQVKNPLIITNPFDLEQISKLIKLKSKNSFLEETTSNYATR